MTDFSHRAGGPAPARRPRPTKHVKYTLGMVLGVDDFDQEFAYLSARDRWLARDLHGYGTVSGLARDRRGGRSDGPRINVAPGHGAHALRAPGLRLAGAVRVPQRLAGRQPASRSARALAASPPARRRRAGPSRSTSCSATRDCPTDDLPIPGEPCRTEDTPDGAVAGPGRLPARAAAQPARARTRRTRSATWCAGSA